MHRTSMVLLPSEIDQRRKMTLNEAIKKAKANLYAGSHDTEYVVQVVRVVKRRVTRTKVVVETVSDMI